MFMEERNYIKILRHYFYGGGTEQIKKTSTTKIALSFVTFIKNNLGHLFSFT